MAFEKEMIASMNNQQAVDAWRMAQVCNDVGFDTFKSAIVAHTKLREACALLDAATHLIDEGERRAFSLGIDLFLITTFQLIWIWMRILAGLK